MVERKIELTWRCTSCGHRNLGRHMACTACGSPKDATEHYEMPPDPAAQASVTDPALIALARAGANWLCAFCGSNARAPEGRCAQCGAGQAEATRPAPLLPARRATSRSFSLTLPIAFGALFVVLVLCGIGAALMARRPSRPPIVQAPAAHRDLAARVERATWEHAVDVERWQIVAREGFAQQKPSDALEVKAAGERVHHVDKLPDGTTTETYTDHETRLENEPYTAQEQCGEDCRSSPETCREHCTNDQNGFATCRTECSGGGQSCVPRYCSVQKVAQGSQDLPRPKDPHCPQVQGRAARGALVHLEGVGLGARSHRRGEWHRLRDALAERRGRRARPGSR